MFALALIIFTLVYLSVVNGGPTHRFTVPAHHLQYSYLKIDPERTLMSAMIRSTENKELTPESVYALATSKKWLLICPKFITDEYDTNGEASQIFKTGALVAREVTVKHPIQAPYFQKPPKAVIKIQDLNSYSSYMSHRGALEMSEPFVGMILNQLMDTYNPGGLPKPGIHSTSVVSGSYYVGFVRTIDFGVCNLNPFSKYFSIDGDSQRLMKKWMNDDSKRRWMSPLPDNFKDYTQHREFIRPISKASLYVMQEQLEGASFTDFITNPEFVSKEYEAWINADMLRTKYLEDPTFIERYRPNMDMLRGFLIQILSTLYYATEVDFTHWDLHAENLLSFKPSKPAKFWDYDIMTFPDYVKEGEPDPNWFEEKPIPIFGLRKDQYSAYTTGEAKKPPKMMSNNEGKAQLVARHPASDLPKETKKEEQPRGFGPFTPFRMVGSVIGNVGSFIVGGGRRGNNQQNRRPEDTYIEDEEEEIIEEKTDFQIPLIRFRVPSSVTHGHLLKIIDFGRSRAKAKNEEVPYYSIFDTYNPFTDLRLLAMDTLSSIQERYYRYAFSEKFNFLPKEFRKEMEEQYDELDNVLQIMLGINNMDTTTRDLLEVQIAKDVEIRTTTVKDYKWMRLLRYALNVYNDPTPNNRYGQGRTSLYLTRHWILITGVNSERKKEMMKRRFRRKIVSILRQPFFRKFRTDLD